MVRSFSDYFSSSDVNDAIWLRIEFTCQFVLFLLFDEYKISFFDVEWFCVLTFVIVDFGFCLAISIDSFDKLVFVRWFRCDSYGRDFRSDHTIEQKFSGCNLSCAVWC